MTSQPPDDFHGFYTGPCKFDQTCTSRALLVFIVWLFLCDNIIQWICFTIPITVSLLLVIHNPLSIVNCPCWEHDITSLRTINNYRKTSSISRTKSQNLNVSHIVLQLSLPNPLKPGVKSSMKMQLEQRRQAMLQLHLSDRQFHSILRCHLY